MSNELDRFVTAQQGVFHTALAELKAGRKRTHWMWFVFPQVKGLGHSEQAIKYGIRDLDEARAFLGHPVLGRRLEQATRVLLGSDVHAREVLGELDYRKFISCMTLFSLVSPSDSVFASALQSLSAVDIQTRTLLGL